MGPGSLFATGRFLESADRWYKISIQYLDAATSRTGDEEFSLIVEQNDEPVAWINNWVDPMPGSLNSIELTGSALTVSGTAFLNQPPNPALLPGSVLAPGTLFEPFALKVNCAA